MKLSLNLKKYLELEKLASETTSNFLKSDEALTRDSLHKVIELASQISLCFMQIVKNEEYSPAFIRAHATMMRVLTNLMNIAITEMEA